jgi:hypothetical protein
VNLKDKRDEDYSAPPAPAYVAYSGEGKAAGYVCIYGCTRVCVFWMCVCGFVWGGASRGEGMCGWNGPVCRFYRC